MELTDFLLARIAEDETVARERPDDDFYFMPDGPAFELVDIGPGWLLTGRPARVLDRCAADRRIVEACRVDYEDALASGDDGTTLAEEVLHALALPYADHPDYREEWRP